jgi:peptidoglycan hydrolase-like protein with peptidoglycan-binding domain
MSGGNVQILQKAVNLAGGKSLTQDGQYGPATTQAVKDLQRVMKLETDGIAGPKTIAALQFLLAQIEANG